MRIVDYWPERAPSALLARASPAAKRDLPNSNVIIVPISCGGCQAPQRTTGPCPSLVRQGTLFLHPYTATFYSYFGALRNVCALPSGAYLHVGDSMHSAPIAPIWRSQVQMQ